MMKTTTLTIAFFLLGFALVLSYLLLQLILVGWKRKYFPASSPVTAQAIAIAGQLLATSITIITVLFPLKDYLNLIAVTGHVQLSGPLWGLSLLCAALSAASYLLAMSLAKMLVFSLFKGRSIAVELQENNIAFATLYAVATIAMALVLLIPAMMSLQAFIPVPNIPTIR